MSDLVARFRAEADSDAAFEAAMKLVRETAEDNERLRKVLRQLVSCHNWSMREEGCGTKVYEAAWAAARAALGD